TWNLPGCRLPIFVIPVSSFLPPLARHRFVAARPPPQPRGPSAAAAAGDLPPDLSLPLRPVFGDPAPIGLGERAPESSGSEIPAVRGRPGLLPPGVLQPTTVHGVESELVDDARHLRSGVGRVSRDRESFPPRRSLRRAPR